MIYFLALAAVIIAYTVGYRCGCKEAVRNISVYSVLAYKAKHAD
jgi:hypothetical protein